MNFKPQLHLGLNSLNYFLNKIIIHIVTSETEVSEVFDLTGNIKRLIS